MKKESLKHLSKEELIEIITSDKLCEERIEMIDEKIYNVLAHLSDAIRDNCEFCAIENGKCNQQRDCFLEVYDYVMGHGRYEVDE